MAQPLHIATPLLASTTLGAAAGRKVWLKMEALQPPGSFKIRGIGLAGQAHARAAKKRFIASSDGNAGLAVAYAEHCLHLHFLPSAFCLRPLSFLLPPSHHGYYTQNRHL